MLLDCGGRQGSGVFNVIWRFATVGEVHIDLGRSFFLFSHFGVEAGLVCCIETRPRIGGWIILGVGLNLGLDRHSFVFVTMLAMPPNTSKLDLLH